MGPVPGRGRERTGLQGAVPWPTPLLSPQWSCSGGPAGRRACPSRTGAPGWRTVTAAAAWMAAGTAARCLGPLPCLGLMSWCPWPTGAPSFVHDPDTHPVRLGAAAMVRDWDEPSPPTSARHPGRRAPWHNQAPVLVQLGKLRLPPAQAPVCPPCPPLSPLWWELFLALGTV